MGICPSATVAGEAGETACPTFADRRLALVAQAVSPACCDFFTASRHGCGLSGGRAIPVSRSCRVPHHRMESMTLSFQEGARDRLATGAGWYSHRLRRRTPQSATRAASCSAKMLRRTATARRWRGPRVTATLCARPTCPANSRLLARSGRASGSKGRSVRVRQSRS